MSIFTFVFFCIAVFFFALGTIAVLVIREERRLKEMGWPR